VYEWEGIPGDQFLALVAARLGRDFSPAMMSELDQLKRRRFNEIFTITPIPEIYQTVAWLQAAGYPLVLVTGTGRDVALRVLRQLNLNQAFSFIVSGDDVARGKPHPDPYLKAADLVGLPPANTLVIENAPAGIQAARQAGMTCVALQTSLEASYLQNAHCILPGHQALIAFLAAEHRRSRGIGAWQVDIPCTKRA
jgi:HAD superfamily hydrolase (TIGR01509 family)